MFKSSRDRAKKKGFEHSITVHDIFVPEFCPLLGIRLVVGKNAEDDKWNSPTLDRIDSTKGYIPGNVWVISGKANSMKSNANLEEAELLVKNWRKLIQALG